MVVLDVVYGFPREKIDEAVAHLRALVTATRAEPGCIAYDVFRNADDPTTFLIHERYVDDAAVEAHRATPHYDEHGVRGLRGLATKREIGTYRPLDA